VEAREELKRDPDSPISNVDIQLGMSAILDMNARKQIGDKFQLNAGLKTVILGKRETWDDLAKSRIGSLGTLSISYGIVNLEYNIRILYDSNISPRRQLDESLVAGIRLSF
jgi:hypothetical protein